MSFYSDILAKNGVPEQAISLQAANLCTGRSYSGPSTIPIKWLRRRGQGG